MDRSRFLTWLMLTAAMWFLFLSFRPKPPQPVQENAKKQEVADPLIGPKTGNVPNEVNATPVDPNAQDARPNNPSQTVTLGSMDPTKGYNLLITLSSQGAGLKRAELVEPNPKGDFKYRALEHEGGYLGFLDLTEDGTIQSVPDGSPAALATSSDANGGLEVGDRLLEVEGKPLSFQLSLEQALQDTKAGESVSLKISRSGKELGYSATLGEAPLDILRVSPREAELVDKNNRLLSLRTTLGSVNGAPIPVGQSSFPSLQPTLEENWAVEKLEVEGGMGFAFRLPLDSYLAASSGPKQFDLVKKYRLSPKGDGKTDGYVLDVETTIVNRNDAPVRLSFRQEGVNGLTLEGWWFSVKISPAMFAAAGARDVAYFSESSYHSLESTRTLQQYAAKHESQPYKLLFGDGEPAANRTLKYIGVDSQYFNASILEHPDQPGALKELRQAAAISLADNDIHKNKRQASNTFFWFDTVEQEVPAGGELTQRYNVFLGPKDSNLLAHHSMDKTIEYGWFGWVAWPLSQVLHFFYGIVRNYGIAIVMLTICVRSLLFPFTRKAMINSQKMQERMQVLQPEMKKINEKYADNFEKRSKAIQELYAKHGFNPAENLAGCLPMFFQLPVFMGLYRCLSVDVALRQEALIPGLAWCSNLAGPDMFYDWSSWMPDWIAGKGNGWLGPYLNLLPLVTVALFLVQQAMLMPKATDEQTRMTQNMMKVMTAFMGVLFFKVPSGLCIYFITSSLWSIVERKLIKKSIPDKDAETGSTESSSPQKKSGKLDSDNAPKLNGQKSRKKNRGQGEEAKPSRLQEIKNLLDRPAVKSGTHRNAGKGPPQKRGKKGKKKR